LFDAVDVVRCDWAVKAGAPADLTFFLLRCDEGHFGYAGISVVDGRGETGDQAGREMRGFTVRHVGGFTRV
jgi:hypothetical protein